MTTGAIRPASESSELDISRASGTIVLSPQRGLKKEKKTMFWQVGWINGIKISWTTEVWASNRDDALKEAREIQTCADEWRARNGFPSTSWSVFDVLEVPPRVWTLLEAYEAARLHPNITHIGVTGRPASPNGLPHTYSIYRVRRQGDNLHLDPQVLGIPYVHRPCHRVGC